MDKELVAVDRIVRDWCCSSSVIINTARLHLAKLELGCLLQVEGLRW